MHKPKTYLLPAPRGDKGGGNSVLCSLQGKGDQRVYGGGRGEKKATQKRPKRGISFQVHLLQRGEGRGGLKGSGRDQPFGKILDRGVRRRIREGLERSLFAGGGGKKNVVPRVGYRGKKKNRPPQGKKRIKHQLFLVKRKGGASPEVGKWRESTSARISNRKRRRNLRGRPCKRGVFR